MGEVKICECPFTSRCHEARQWLQSKFRENPNYTVKDCDFYKLIKEHEEKENG